MKYIKFHIFGNILLGFLFIIVVCLGIFFTLFQSHREFSGGENHVAFLLDVSQSMNTQDVDSIPRLTAAKRSMIGFMRDNPQNEYALIIFAGEAQRVLPFTTDIGLVSTFLAGIDHNNILAQGTNLLSGIKQSIDSFADDETGNIIIFSDGQEDTIDFDAVILQKIDSQQIHVSVVGVGSLQGGYIPTQDILTPYKVYNGERVVSRLHEDILRDMSRQLGGEYLSLDEFSNSGLGEKIPVKFSHISYGGFIVFGIWCVYLYHLYIVMYRKTYEF